MKIINQIVIFHWSAMGDLVHTYNAISNINQNKTNIILVTQKDYDDQLNKIFNINTHSISLKFPRIIIDLIKLLLILVFSKSILIMHKKNFIFETLRLFKKKNFFYSKKTDKKLINRFEALKVSFDKLNLDFEYSYLDRIDLKIPNFTELAKKNYILISVNGGNKYAPHSARTIDIEIINSILRRFNDIQIILTGSGDSDDKYYSKIMEKNECKNIINLSSKLNVKELLYLLQNSKFNILNDSLPLQLAQYCKNKTYAFFGPTNPQEVLLPNSKITSLVSESICKFCYDHIYGPSNLMYNCPNNLCGKYKEWQLNEYF